MGDNGSMNLKEPRISVRINSALKVRLEAVTKHTGIDEATIVRNCVEAICDHFEETGQITFPLAVTAKRKKTAEPVLNPPMRETEIARLNEPGVSYRKTKPEKE